MGRGNRSEIPIMNKTNKQTNKQTGTNLSMVSCQKYACSFADTKLQYIAPSVLRHSLHDALYSSEFWLIRLTISCFHFKIK